MEQFCILEAFSDHIHSVLRRFQESQKAAMETVAAAVADRMENGGLLYVVGSGHSHMVGEEFYARAGGLACIRLIAPMELTLGEHPMKSTVVERSADYAHVILTQYKIKRPNMLFSEYTYNWTCQTEKDASGKIIKDAHTCPDVTMAITFGYKYDGDKLTEYSYEVVDSKTNSYFCFVYTPVKVKCDSLQIALMNIYSNHAYSNNVTSFYGITTDWSK